MVEGNNVLWVHVAIVFRFFPLVAFSFVMAGHDLFSSR